MTRARSEAQRQGSAKKVWKEQAERHKKNEEREAEAKIHVEAAESQKEETKVITSTPQVRTQRMQKFIDFVNGKKILPFTPYAAKQWRKMIPGTFMQRRIRCGWSTVIS